MTLPRNLDLNLLRVFDVLMQERSVTAAARRLNMSQPSCSNALERLRSALGDRVLERQGQTMVPSQFAESFWPTVRRALNDLGTGFSELQSFSPKTFDGHLRIGMDPYSSAAFGAKLAIRVLSEAPKARLSILPTDVNNIDDTPGFLDCGIGTIWTEQTGIETEEVLLDEFVVVAGRGSLGVSEDRPLDLATYTSARHLLLSDKGIVPGNVDAALASVKRARRTCFASPLYDTLASVLLETDCLATIGRSLAVRLAARTDLLILEPPLPLDPFWVNLAWYKRETNSAQLVWLRDICRDVIGT